MSTLAQKIAAVPSHLGRHVADYARGRARHAALAPYATPGDVVRALDAGSSLPASARYAIVAALVAEHQDATCPLWGSLLVLAFRPMLLRIRARQGRPDDEDRDERVLVAFFDAIGDARVGQVGAYATIALQRATWKALSAQRRRERGHDDDVELVPFDEERDTPCAPDGMTVAEIRAELAWEERRREREARAVQASGALRRLRPAKALRAA